MRRDRVCLCCLFPKDAAPLDMPDALSFTHLWYATEILNADRTTFTVTDKNGTPSLALYKRAARSLLRTATVRASFVSPISVALLGKSSTTSPIVRQSFHSLKRSA